MTQLERLQQNGIRRLGSPKTGFRYHSFNASRIVKADLKRINDLRIPPAWKDVAINSAATGRIQAVGKDVAGRWQYLYHANHTRQQETKKFQRLIKFAQSLPALRSTVARDLRQQDLGRDTVLAAVLRILSTCFMRPGSQVYASENGSYGIATLRRSHVKVRSNSVEFDFPGKSGVRQNQVLRDRRVAAVIKELLKIPGPTVFKYQNGGGEFCKLTRPRINAQIKSIMGENFSAKDFRTWAGTLICANVLAREGTEGIENKTLRKKKIVTAVKETAEVLGNTPAVCRGSYISPRVLQEFERGHVLDNYFNSIDSLTSYRGRALHKSERALLKLLKNAGSK